MTLRTLYLLTVLLVLVYSSTKRPFNFCFYLQGECHYRCPRGFYTLYRAPILCLGKGYCCIKSEEETTRPPPSPPRTTTVRTTFRTTTPFRPSRGCGISQAVSSRIIGGIDAKRCEFPWVVHIRRDASPCGGSLIDDRHILTAGHCVSNVHPSLLTVTVGEYNTDRRRPRAEFQVSNYRVFIPSTYSRQYYVDDVAIIKLDQPIDFSRYECLAPICLPERWQGFRGMTCTVVGWGVTRANYTYRDPPLSAILKKVDVNIIDDSVCQSKFGTNFFRDNSICAGVLEGGKDSCGGDSGGPLMCTLRDRFGDFRMYLTGTVSTGAQCAERNTPAIYTEIAKHRDWIDSVINND